MTTKTADSKGRIALGSRFAGRTVIIEDIDATEVRVTLARVIPEREAWLHKNAKAKVSVFRGLTEAKTGKTAKAPDLGADSLLAKRLND